VLRVRGELGNGVAHTKRCVWPGACVPVGMTKWSKA
jgi:hypothetical protein